VFRATQTFGVRLFRTFDGMQADRRRSLDTNASGDRPGRSDRHGRATRGVDRRRDRTDDDAATTSRDRRRRDDEVATTIIDGGRNANRHHRSQRAERARPPIAMRRNQNRSAQLADTDQVATASNAAALAERRVAFMNCSFCCRAVNPRVLPAATFLRSHGTWAERNGHTAFIIKARRGTKTVSGSS